MGIEMQVLRTYDGSQSGDKVVKEATTTSKNGLILEGAIVEVEDKQRAALLEQFGIAKPVDEDVNLDLPNYTEAELNGFLQPKLREIAKGLGVEGSGSMTNAELRASILNVQGEPADDDEDKDDSKGTGAENDQDPANTGALTTPSATNGAEGTPENTADTNRNENDGDPDTENK